jgi:hypothetical protein
MAIVVRAVASLYSGTPSVAARDLMCPRSRAGMATRSVAVISPVAP